MVVLAPFRKARDIVAGTLGRRFPVTVVGRAPTERAARYGRQLASHLGRKVETSWDEDTGRGRVTFGPGEVLVLIAQPEELVATLTCPSARADELKDVVERHLVRFGAKEGLEVRWQDGRR